MTREELKAHCERQIQQFERVEKIMPVTPNDWKRYEEHKLVLELLEQEPKWIPMSERLPEKYVKVLVTTDDGHVTIGELFMNDDWLIYEDEVPVQTDELLAWMPLPEPYEPQESEE